MISFKSWEKEGFAEEFKNFITKEQESIEVELNDQLMKNIDIFFDTLNEFKKIKIIVFIKDKNYEFDIVCFSRVKAYFHTFFGKLSLKYNLKFTGLDENFIITELIGKRNYFIYCNMNNIDTKWQEGMIKTETNLINKYSYMRKYPEFNFLESIFKNYPISSFNFPQEKDIDRFVYYYYVYNEKTKQDLIDFLHKLEFNTKYISYVKKASLNIPVMGYGLGFSYKDNKIIRRTLYISFYDPNDVEKTKEYFKEIIGLNLDKYKFNNIWFGGIDDYFKFEEIKLYEENNIFKIQLEDTELESILKYKPCTRAVKFRENELITEKFEFNLGKYFNDKEKGTLKQKKLISNNSKILAIYVKDKKIIKYVGYDL